MKVLRLGRVKEAFFVKRLNRFVVEAELADGSRIQCLNTNTGRLHDILTPGAKLLCSPKTGGRTSHRLLAASFDKGVSIVDTWSQMKVFEHLVENSVLAWLGECTISKKAPRVESSVLDYLLECDGEQVFVEVKSAVLRHERRYAGYPDCPTDRGVRHLKLLSAITQEGGRALLVFIAALPGASAFKPYVRGDPRIAEALEHAVSKGVEVRAVGLEGVVEGGFLWAVLYSANLPVVLP